MGRYYLSTFVFVNYASRECNHAKLFKLLIIFCILFMDLFLTLGTDYLLLYFKARFPPFIYAYGHASSPGKCTYPLLLYSLLQCVLVSLVNFYHLLFGPSPKYTMLILSIESKLFYNKLLNKAFVYWNISTKAHVLISCYCYRKELYKCLYFCWRKIVLCTNWETPGTVC